MQITTRSLDADTLRQLVLDVGAAHYDGNLMVEVERTRGNQYRFKMGTHDSHGTGSRRSWSGRRGRYACWHAFRDVLASIFLADPHATVRTRMTAYKGARGFLSHYPDTADQNVGSMMQPTYMDELCDCTGHETTPALAALVRKEHGTFA